MFVRRFQLCYGFCRLACGGPFRYVKLNCKHWNPHYWNWKLMNANARILLTIQPQKWWQMVRLLQYSVCWSEYMPELEEPELDEFEKLGNSSIVRWDLASHDWISIQKNYLKIPESNIWGHYSLDVLQPNFSRHGSVPIRSESSIALPRFANGASMLSEVWDQKEDFGLKWKRTQVKPRISSSSLSSSWCTKCKPVSSGSKVKLFTRRNLLSLFQLLLKFERLSLRFQSKGTFFGLIKPQIWF